MNSKLLRLFCVFSLYLGAGSCASALQLELTNPLDYQQFLSFESMDFGLHWQRALPSSIPRVYSLPMVEKWREMFAINCWLDFRFKAEQQVCLKATEEPCVLKIERTWQVCEKEFVAPNIEK